MNITKVASFFITAFAIIFSLIYGRDFLMPLIFAFLIWFLVREIKALMCKINFIKNKFPNWLSNIIASAIIFSILFVIESILESSIRSISESYQLYEDNIGLIANKINIKFNIDILSILKDYSMDFDFGSILGAILSSLTDMLGNTFLIIIYALFIFIEESNFQYKLKAVFSTEEKYNQTADILSEIETSVSKYIGMKTIVSIITGTLSYIVLYFVKIDSPLFWAFLIFLLNYIPAVGSLIATIFPALFSLIQFAEFTPFLIILILVGGIQTIIGNIVEPKVMGNTLNLSSLVTLLSLSFWGSIWGVTGMLLSVPIMVIIVIVFSKFPKTKGIAIMLSDKGEV